MCWCSEGQSRLEGDEEFPGCPVVRTLRFHCRGPGFDLVRELRSHKPHGTAKELKKKKKRYDQQLKLWTLRSLTVLYKRKRVQGWGPENLDLRAKQRETSLEAKKQRPEK